MAAFAAIFGVFWAVFGDAIKALLLKLFNRAAEQTPPPSSFANEGEAALAVIDKAIELARGQPFKRLALFFMRRHAVRNNELVHKLDSDAKLELTAFDPPLMTGRKEEVVAKIAELVQDEFEGNYRKAFDHYDSNKDGKASNNEISRLMVDAEIGSRLTRWAYVDGLVKEIDKDNDGQVSFKEFEDASKT